MHDTPLLGYISLITIPPSKTTPSWSGVRKRTNSRGYAPNQRSLSKPIAWFEGLCPWSAVPIGTDSTSSTNWRNALSHPEVPEGCGRIESIRGLCPCSTSYGLKPTVLISAIRHGLQRFFRDMCRMPAVAEGHVPGWPESNTPQRSLRDMCGMP